MCKGKMFDSLKPPLKLGENGFLIYLFTTRMQAKLLMRPYMNF